MVLLNCDCYNEREIVRAGSLGQARRLLAGLGLVRGARGNMAAVRGPGQPALPEGGSLYDDITHTVRTVTSLSLSLSLTKLSSQNG